MKDSGGRWKPYSSRDKFPCKVDGVDCKKRYPACQDTCPDMLAAKDKNQQRKTTEREKRSVDHGVSAVQYSGYLAVSRKKMPER